MSDYSRDEIGYELALAKQRVSRQCKILAHACFIKNTKLMDIEHKTMEAVRKRLRTLEEHESTKMYFGEKTA